MHGEIVRTWLLVLVALPLLSGCGGPDSNDASKFAESYAERHKRVGETLEFFGCRQKDEDNAEQGFACDTVYRPRRGLRFDLLPKGDDFRVVHVRPGIRRGLKLPGLVD